VPIHGSPARIAVAKAHSWLDIILATSLHTPRAQCLDGDRCNQGGQEDPADADDDRECARHKCLGRKVSVPDCQSRHERKIDRLLYWPTFDQPHQEADRHDHYQKSREDWPYHPQSDEQLLCEGTSHRARIHIRLHGVQMCSKAQPSRECLRHEHCLNFRRPAILVNAGLRWLFHSEVNETKLSDREVAFGPLSSKTRRRPSRCNPCLYNRFTACGIAITAAATLCHLSPGRTMAGHDTQAIQPGELQLQQPVSPKAPGSLFPRTRRNGSLWGDLLVAHNGFCYFFQELFPIFLA